MQETVTGLRRPTSEADASDLALQERLLVGTSRTFALTIPCLPEQLRTVVGTAYLLCRIVDTIEDEPDLDAEATGQLAETFVEVVWGRSDAGGLAARLGPRLTAATSPAERELVTEMPRVIRLLRSYPDAQQEALGECVETMARGMVEFSRRRSLAGLADLPELDRYCYHVAGVVGEMLTRLFCDLEPQMARERERLMRLAVSFGQGLQMTNILKDTWEDRRRGACWLPRDVLSEHGVELLTAAPGEPGFPDAVSRLVGIARGHLEAALEYTLLLPRREVGLRRFCLGAIGMALLTLRRIHARPGFASGGEVKISRRSVAAVMLVSRLAAPCNRLLRSLFRLLARPLPQSGRAPD